MTSATSAHRPTTHHPTTQEPATDDPVVVDRREGPWGEVVLRRRAERMEIISNGCFLMDTSDGTSERLLVRAALDALDTADGPGRPTPPGPRRDGPARVLIGGLGVGFSLAEAAADPRAGRITVVERESAVVEWHTVGDAPLARFSAGALARDDVRCVRADLLDHLRTTDERYDAICLDIDNGPDWTVTEGNAALYGAAGLRLLRGRLAPGGVLAVWSAAASEPFEERLRAAFPRVTRREVPVLVARGVPDVVYLASA
ncbi:spermidine synthase [Allostreptomyces psammosilenae]|uniref:Spermidine synthase n=1 Tax=Allostreptomyces psammosilenae TaxID=1892865 RepID=A0A852ZVD1_9ACTN|nr:spermidine synthase [Allostreptomyces psammosilenae]NYI06336.1 hypothetical protein [Allostreptomyces psammosilenae]